MLIPICHLSLPPLISISFSVFYSFTVKRGKLSGWLLSQKRNYGCNMQLWSLTFPQQEVLQRDNHLYLKLCFMVLNI